jgi:hypothetical protein
MMQNPLHTPEEMRQISNLAHLVEGLILGIAALIVLLQARGIFAHGRRRYAWPALVALAGAFLLAYLVVPYHGLARARAQWTSVFGTAQQRQHLIMSLLVLLGGGAELLALSREVRWPTWRFVWPSALVAIGVIFLAHSQHGTSDAIRRAVLIHRALGVTFAVAGMLAAAGALRDPRRKLQASWALALLVAAGLLVAYREPEGAFHSASGVHE